MSIAESVTGAKDSALQRMSEMKLDRTARENNDLKTENRLLRDELAENRSERKHVLDLLDKAQISVSEPSKGRFPFLRILALGGGAYAVLTKTGGMEKVREWVNTARGKTEEIGSDLAAKRSEVTHKVGDSIEHAGRKIEATGEKIEEAAGTPEK